MIVVSSGNLVNVHVPDVGKPLRTTLPVDKRHVGFVIVPTVGVVGIAFTVIGKVDNLP